VATHYTRLGVAPDAAANDVQKAYHSQARRWHPDRFVGRTEAESSRAEDAMRKVNEAWRVLGDPTRRRQYDRELAAAAAGASSVGEAINSNDGVTRIDPRLLDPKFLAARRQQQQEELEAHRSGAVRVLATVGFFGLLIGIFVFTAYANGSRATAPTTTVFGPDIGVEAGACVRQLSDGQLLTVPCEGTKDGVVIGARELEGSCPARTVREALLPNGIVVCLG